MESTVKASAPSPSGLDLRQVTESLYASVIALVKWDLYV